jgi:hypothetical protein
MSANYTIVSRPPVWVSAHRKCEFKYGITGTILSSGYDDGNGYLKVNLGGSMAFTLAAGDRVYIDGAPYTGFHVVREFHSSIQYTLETLYTSAGSGYIFPVVLPTIQIYKGYADNELILPLYPSGSLDLYDIQPRTLAAEFQPEFGTDGKITFDISGYLKAVLETPYVAGYNEDETSYQYRKSATIDYLPMNYAKVDIMLLEQGGTIANLECQLYVANSALTSADLNRRFFNTTRPLSVLQRPPSFTNGVNY